jgi:hypothetical protein
MEEMWRGDPYPTNQQEDHLYCPELSAGKSPRIGTSLRVHFLSALAVHSPNALDSHYPEIGFHTPPQVNYFRSPGPAGSSSWKYLWIPWGPTLPLNATTTPPTNHSQVLYRWLRWHPSPRLQEVSPVGLHWAWPGIVRNRNLGDFPPKTHGLV